MSSSCKKRRRLNNNINNTVSTIFKNKNVKDEKQCIGLINILNSCITNRMISFDMNVYILKEIAEYATGILIKCNSATHTSLDSRWIHHLYGNNFDVNQQYTNDLLLYNYKCEDEKCLHESHIFECKVCDKRTQINKLKECSPMYKKTYNNIHPYRVCSNKNCHGIYCSKCYSNSGVHCYVCTSYYCNACSKLSGFHCRFCCKYYCGDWEHCVEYCSYCFC